MLNKIIEYKKKKKCKHYYQNRIKFGISLYCNHERDRAYFSLMLENKIYNFSNL